MRNFRTFVNDPAGNDPAATDYIGATNINNFLGEVENLVSRSGQSLSTDDGTSDSNQLQMAESAFLHGVKSQGFVDSGSANTYEITPISGSSGVKIPADYANMDGAAIWFTPANASTTDSTVNIGQTSGTLLGAKKLLNNDESAITTEITTDGPIEIRYDSSADSGSGAWLVQPWSSPQSVTSDTYIQVQDQKTSGTSGGTFTSGSYQTHTLNTVLYNDVSGASLSSNQIVLPAGTYEFIAWGLAYKVGRFRYRLYDATAAAELFLATNSYSPAVDDQQGYSSFFGKFTLSVTSNIELQAQCQTTRATDGFGISTSIGTQETYADVYIKKVG